MTTTIIYKVYGCNDEGRPILYAEFLNLKEACYYAVANCGKIHYNLPEIEEQIYTYTEAEQTVSVNTKTIEPARIYYMNKI